MHLNHLDLNLLVGLNALLTEQSVTRAAGQLSISQPAMSGALTRLREHFQDELIQRVGRNMVLTPFGAAMVPKVRELLASTSKLANMRPGFDPASTDRSFTVMTSDYAMAVFVPILVPRLTQVAPRAVLNIEVRSPDHDERMASGLIDAVIVPRAMASLDHPSLPLFEEDYVCIAWTGNTLIGERISLEQFLAAGHVVRTIARANAETLFDARLDELGLSRNVVVRVPSLETIARVVVGTQFIATVHRRLAVEAARQYPLRVLAHPVEAPALALTLQWPSFRDEDTGNAWLRRMIVSAADAMRADDAGAIRA